MSPSKAASPPPAPGTGRMRSCARPSVARRWVRSRAISVVVAAERAAIEVRLEAMANRFFTL